MTVLSNVISKRAARTFGLLLGFALFASAVIQSPALATNGPHPNPTEQREVLLNGLPIVTQTVAGDRVAVVLIVRAGAMFDPAGKSGLAALTAQSLRAGAGSYTGERIEAELRDSGATLSIEPRWDGIWLTAEGPASSLTAILDVMSLLVTAPRFDSASIETAKSAALAVAKRREQSPEAVAEIVLARGLYGKHTYGRPVDGDSTSIAALTLGDVKFFFSKFYSAGSSMLAVVSPRSIDEVLKLAKPRFGRWNKGKLIPATFLPPTPATSTRVFVVDWPESDRAVVDVGLLTSGRNTKTAPGYPGLTTALVKEAITRLPQGTHPSVGWDLRILQSPLSVSFRVAPSDVGSSIEAVRETMRSLQTNGWSGDTRVAAQSGPALEARTLATRAFYESQQFASVSVSGDSIPIDVAAAAKAVLTPDALTVVVVGKSSEIVEPLKAKGYAVEMVARP
jgi:hypothetical protein